MRTQVDEKYIVEWRKCRRSPAYFIDTYCQILNPIAKRWIPFKLWNEQYDVLKGWDANQYNIVLKARQLGLTWLAVGYALWGMVTVPNFEAILVSKTMEESNDLMSQQRMRGMYDRLPDWLKADGVVLNNVRHWRLSNGSGGRTFAPKNVDSYSANIMILDESDYPAIDLASLLTSAQPVIDGGGKLILISRGYKDNPESDFKRLYRAAKAGKNSYAPYFLPWDVVSWRTQEWYEQKKAELYETWGSHDELYEQYPATDEQALAPRTLDKRIPPAFLSRCYEQAAPLTGDDLRRDVPALPGLAVYRNPRVKEVFVIGADPAEGNPSSDDSAASVLDARTGEEVATLAGKFEVDTFASYLQVLAKFYNDAPVMVERNNHGHAVILWLRDNARGVKLLKGIDRKHGWQTNKASKAELYTEAVAMFREGDTVIHDFATMTQLQSIDGSTLKAPEGAHDDRAMAFVLALAGMARRPSDKKRVVSASGLYPSQSRGKSRPSGRGRMKRTDVRR